MAPCFGVFVRVGVLRKHFGTSTEHSGRNWRKSVSAIERLNEPPCDLEYVRLRCVQDGDCWMWAGVKKHKSLPLLFFRRVTVTGEKCDLGLYVRHLVLWLVKGEKPKLGRFRVTVTTCESDLCVNPDHVKIITRKTLNKNSAKDRPVSASINMAKARRKGSKLSDEDVREIRASEGTTKELANKFGISQQYVSMIRLNMWRRDYSNPFSGLLASNDSRKAA